jgi:hypothetical protein
MVYIIKNKTDYLNQKEGMPCEYAKSAMRKNHSVNLKSQIKNVAGEGMSVGPAQKSVSKHGMQNQRNIFGSVTIAPKESISEKKRESGFLSGKKAKDVKSTTGIAYLPTTVDSMKQSWLTVAINAPVVVKLNRFFSPLITLKTMATSIVRLFNQVVMDSISGSKNTITPKDSKYYA